MLKHHILNNTDALAYMFGGKATFTICNENTGNRFTYKISLFKERYFIRLLISPDKYDYMGEIMQKACLVHKNNSKMSSDALSFKVFNAVLFALNNNNLKENIKIYHHGNCGKCGRELTVPSSILRGLGDYCAGLK